MDDFSSSKFDQNFLHRTGVARPHQISRGRSLISGCVGSALLNWPWSLTRSRELWFIRLPH